MDKAWIKTALYLIIAAGLGAAVYATRPVSREVALLSDVGKPLAPLLTDPLAVKALEVIAYDPDSARTKAFKVAFDGSRWVIPSNHGYPADAAEKLAAAASAFSGLVRERIVTDHREDHAGLGVLAPDDESALATGRSGLGTRVTLRDSADRALADLVIGGSPTAEARADPFSAAPTAGKRYVREANSDRVYVTTLSSGFSTRFADWVETDLLKLPAASVTGIFSDRYRIDETTGAVTDGARLTLTRADSRATDRPWTMTASPGDPAPTQSLNQDRVGNVLSTAAGIRIIGVRPKPAKLSAVLAGGAAQGAIGLADQLSLQSRGFFLSTDGRLAASEGQLTFQCDDGVTYTLWFGGPVPDGEDAAAGGSVGGDATKTGSNTETKPTTPAKGVARFVMVTASFDPALAPEPPKPAPTDQGATPESTDPAIAARQAWESKVEAGKKRAAELSKRFADWYYVIDGTSLSALRPSAEDLRLAVPSPSVPPEGLGSEEMSGPTRK